VRSAMSTKS